MNESYLSQILAQLGEGQRITTMSVLRTVKTSELRHFIAIIRKTLDVKSVWVENNGKRFKEYFL